MSNLKKDRWLEKVQKSAKEDTGLFARYRPHWQTVVAENEAFLKTFESE